MLANCSATKVWWYMEVPRTGSSTIERTLKHLWPEAQAIYAKHWPVLPPTTLRHTASVISVRNPYSRAVSCWQYFTKPGDCTFLEWTQQRLEGGFRDYNVEARPQSFWFDLWNWDTVIEQEKLESQFWQFIGQISPNTKRFPLRRYNDINGQWVNRVRKETSRDRPWEAYYCSESQQIVREIYNSDFQSLSDLYSKEFPGT